VPLTGRPISRAVLRAVPRADFEAQALARAGHEHDTSTKAVGPGRASVVPNRAVLVPAQRARPVWPPIWSLFIGQRGGQFLQGFGASLF
jgi:hypothetical protein